MPNKRPTRLFEMPGADIVEIEITRPLPETCSVGLTYQLEGTVKVAGIGAPPFVYAEVTPLRAGEVTYERGLPKPISGEFSIDLRFTYTGDYEVIVLATPAPLHLPVVGVEPVLGKSDIMTVEVVSVAPEFEVSNLVISPAEVQVGYPVIISCLVTNIGAEAGTYIIHLGGDFVADKTVTLQPGESRTVSFEVTPTVAKTYSVSVDGLHGSFVATEEAVADIRVEDLEISPSEVMVGETVTISVTATNYGTAAGSKVITCDVI
ncbi:hypothetical protein ES703_37350 [subsurface metagenome]